MAISMRSYKLATSDPFLAVQYKHCAFFGMTNHLPVRDKRFALSGMTASPHRFSMLPSTPRKIARAICVPAERAADVATDLMIT